ncbi:MAG: hypothetical protein P8Q99_12140 [Paracoccaceae bacterium]|jgi:hypothetical protein|nr:hypothetical protein RB2150_12971 [Rhodobacteraceae bacterium HTCC2150]MDG1532086.1 hypothetical protein [Paracoccaceae bacterium]
MNIALLIPNDLQSHVQRTGDALGDLEPLQAELVAAKVLKPVR